MNDNLIDGRGVFYNRRLLIRQEAEDRLLEEMRTAIYEQPFSEDTTGRRLGEALEAIVTLSGRYETVKYGTEVKTLFTADPSSTEFEKAYRYTRLQTDIEKHSPLAHFVHLAGILRHENVPQTSALFAVRQALRLDSDQYPQFYTIGMQVCEAYGFDMERQQFLKKARTWFPERFGGAPPEKGA